jgi:rhodanese-related sulfurtransferase
VDTIDTEGVQELLGAGAQLVEVLPKDAFDREHLPGAINIPLTEMTEEAVGRLDRSRPVIAYCFDHECDLSPRAAAWLEVLGFEQAYDYTASKVAWLAMGLPFEGTDGPATRAGGRLEHPPTFALDDDVAALGAVFDDWPVAVVLDGDVVVGVVRPEVRSLPPDTPLRRVLQPGPPSVRPSIPIRELAASMDRDGERWVLVTRLDGTWLGFVRRDGLEGDA